ncbi:TonB-dependent receptor [Reichenbachiella versicolor]|uniref:TonB-dependent receptor n=1 Tax=Reichenbachiella versicolor TaxID=1821036 RepID=UPI000D6E96C7|nr:TonB-dependent receptor [Reichenbachiella versicolor]
MKGLAFILLILNLATQASAITISGIVTSSGEALPGVNVYIQDSYDGATSNMDGLFSFETSESGSHTLIVSMIGYQPIQQEITINNSPIQLNFNLKEEINQLNGVTITAGAFEASDEKKSTILKPLDVAMTAGALADIPAAMNTLPGTSRNAESGRLFVRGGTADETQAFIDGLWVNSFYNQTPNNIPTRSRFSPFLFKGTFFSTGGYSAEFGQALSSVLSLNSVDVAPETQTELGLMTVGGQVAHTQAWENASVYGQVGYMNLDPYMNLVEQAYDWKDGITSYDGTFMYSQKITGDDMLKVYVTGNQSDYGVVIPSPNNTTGDYVQSDNHNFYLNTSYKRAINENTSAYLGLAYGELEDMTQFNEVSINTNETSTHAKTYVATDYRNVTIKTGAEWIFKSSTQLTDVDTAVFKPSFKNSQLGAFSEADYYITKSWTVRAGLRYEHYGLTDQHVFSPRLSTAYKTSENSQVSFAYGKFHQLAPNDLLYINDQLSYEEADHYMLSYQLTKNDFTLRGEIYQKNYDELIKFDPSQQFNPTLYDNSGSGYARGFDFFFRDGKTIKNADYWITYSFIDTKRDFRNYPYEVRPQFAAMHNISVVYKHFVPELKTQFGASWSFNSGRPYNNPNEEEFNGSMSPNYADLSFNAAYLHRSNVIFYVSVSNLTGRDNVFGYQYANAPDDQGVYKGMPVGQPAPRFYLLGVFITLSKDKQKNQLEYL